MKAKTRRAQEAKTGGDGQARNILDVLSAGLAEDEIRKVLSEAVSSLDQPGLDRLIKKLGHETGATLSRLLEFQGGGGAPRPGRAKVRQEWKNAWRDWEDVVTESGDENGKYVLQDHHWEEPCFDPGSLAEDLEPIAARMRPLIRLVFEEDLDPSFSFSDAVARTADGVGCGLPEWMEPFQAEGLGLGPEATACLLEWEWLAAQRNGAGAFAFVDKVRKLETSAQNLELDEKTVAGFVRKLSAKDRAEILRGILGHKEESRWKEALGSPHSGWFTMYQGLCRLKAPARYLQSCRVNISEDWKLALPVARKLLAKKAFEDAIRISEEGIRTFLGLGKSQAWDPKEVLLAGHQVYRRGEPERTKAAGLLDVWRRAAQALRDDETAYALGLQTTLCRGWADWDASLHVFEEIPSRYADMTGRLFAQWRGLVADESLGRASWRGSHEMPHWIHALAEAARSGKGPQAFHRSVRGWLGQAERTSAKLGGALGALATLTIDLDDGKALRDASGKVHQLVFPCAGGGDRRLAASRRRWLERLKGRELLPGILSFWRRNFARMLPNPGEAMGSNYSRCVEWLAALYEFAPPAYDRVVRRWALTHRRRGNLWAALREKGLPLNPNALGRRRS